jgi:hypothetical protein
MKGPGFESQQGQEICSSPKPPERLPGATQHFHSMSSSPEVKLPGRKVDHSPLPTAEVKNEWR